MHQDRIIAKAVWSGRNHSWSQTGWNNDASQQFGSRYASFGSYGEDDEDLAVPADLNSA